MAFCRNCGNKLDDGAKFCPKCGTQADKLVSDVGISGGEPTSALDTMEQSRSENSESDSSYVPTLNIGKWPKLKFGVSVAVFFVIMGICERSCGNKSTSTSKKNPPQQEIVTESEPVGKQNDIVGTYEVTDNVGCTIRITIDEDETATVTGVRGEGITYYCSWTDFINSGGGIMIQFSDEMPLLVFEGGTDRHNSAFKRFFLKDGWLYSEYDNARSKNPKWRLKATKIE